MSGHKRTTISLSQEEYRKLHEAEMRLRFMNEKVPNIIQEARSDITQEFQSELENMQVRQTALLDSLEQVNLNVYDLEQSTGQNLLEQQLALHQGFTEVVGSYQVETESALAAMESQVQSQLRALLDSHEQDWSWMANEWHKQAASVSQKQHIAKDWLQAASTIDQFIHENYDHELLSPGAVKRAESRLIQAQNNLTQDLFEASISASQEAYIDLSELHIELEQKQSEYQLLTKRVRLEVAKVHELFEQSKVVPAIDLDGNTLPFKVNVDYWCDGKLTELQQEFENVMHDFLDEQAAISTHDLQNLVNDYLPCLEDQIVNFTFDARLKVINAQLRMNIAEIVVQALYGQGYALDNSYFLTGDKRQAYQANLFNYEGSQVVVMVDPLSDKEVSNELHLYTSDAQTKTGHELKQRALEIRRALLSSGLQVGTILANRNSPDQAIFQHEANSSTEYGHQSSRVEDVTTVRRPKLDIHRQ